MKLLMLLKYNFIVHLRSIAGSWIIFGISVLVSASAFGSFSHNIEGHVSLKDGNVKSSMLGKATYLV